MRPTGPSFDTRQPCHANGHGCLRVEMEGEITALRLGRGGKRVNVYLDGAFAFAVAKVLAAGLRRGQRLDAVAAAKLQAADEIEQGVDRCLGLLARRPRSRRELDDYLRRRGVTAGAREAVLGRLGERGLVDDASFARVWVENRSTFRPRSRRALAVELRRKGVVGESAASALAAVDDESAARTAARSYARRLRGLERREFSQRLLGYLGRRGFTYEVARPVVTEIWREMESAPAAETVSRRNAGK
jgi:regulatory protein